MGPRDKPEDDIFFVLAGFGAGNDLGPPAEGWVSGCCGATRSTMRDPTFWRFDSRCWVAHVPAATAAGFDPTYGQEFFVGKLFSGVGALLR
jgi:hypothetical protein